MRDVSKSTSVQKVVICYHCGNETLMNKTGEHRWGATDDFARYIHEMFACPTCHKITLIESYSDEFMQRLDTNGNYEWYYEEKVLFPINSLDDNAIPKRIRNAFGATLKVRNIDSNVCLMALRRTLELILVDKGATKWGLKEKIKELSNNGILPEVLKEASALTKQFGDDAAHGKNNDIELDSRDIDSLIQFTEYIIEYLYVLPFKMEQLKNKMAKQEES